MDSNIERRLAIVDLLSRPDSPDLHRGHRLILEGKADRYRIVPQLASVFIQAKLLELCERRALMACREQTCGPLKSH
jgi:hypothetical protein